MVKVYGDPPITQPVPTTETRNGGNGEEKR